MVYQMNQEDWGCKRRVSLIDNANGGGINMNGMGEQHNKKNKRTNRLEAFLYINDATRHSPDAWPNDRLLNRFPFSTINKRY